MINDLLKSVRASLYERTASPLFGAFAVSWLLWNWKTVVVILSAMAVVEKFAYVEEAIYSSFGRAVLLLAVGPALTALIFLFGYPYPAKYVYRFWRKQQKELKDIRQQIDDVTPLTIEESRRIRQQVSAIQIEYDNELRRAAEEQERLKQAVSDQQERARELESKLEDERNKRVLTVPTAVVSDAEISETLRHQPYRLNFYPKQGGRKSKSMMFGPNGRILEGQSDYEHSWRVTNGRLEILRKDGSIHSRFYFHPASKVFTHTNEDDTLSTRGQYLVPDDASSEPNVPRARPRAKPA